MDAFQSYKQDFEELRESIKKRIEMVGTTRGDAKRKEIRAAQEEIDDADEVLRSLQLTSQRLGNNAQVKAKVKQFEDELSQLKASIRRAETFFGSADDRSKLMAGSTLNDLSVTSSDQRAAVINDTERLRNTTDVIKNALRVAVDTEQVGRDSLLELEDQKETIGRSRLKIRSVDESLATASRLLRGMKRRVMTNKLISLVLALIMLGGIGLIVYFKWFDGPSAATTTTTLLTATNATNAATAAQ